MTQKQKNINIIHNCENHFFNWLKFRLFQKGVAIDDQFTLTDILSIHEPELVALKQHIKQLQRWNKIKDECYSLSQSMNGNGEQSDHLQTLIEKAAFEGQVLWLTIQEA